jgi:hypothetical protein
MAGAGGGVDDFDGEEGVFKGLREWGSGGVRE